MISNKDLRVEDGNIIINGEKHPLDPAVNALTKRANIVQGKFSALDTRLDAIEALEKTASGNPISLTGVAAAYAMGLSMTIEPIQSGSGDPSPTNVRPISGLIEGKVTRTGKNLLPMTIEAIKADNTGGSWDGNVYSTNGVSFEIFTNSDGLITGIKANGTASTYALLRIFLPNPKQGDYVINGALEGGSLNSYDIWYGIRNESDTGWVNTGYDYGSGKAVSVNINCPYIRVEVEIRPKYTANNLMFYPMIRSASFTDPTFEPYTPATATITFGQTVYGGSVNFKTGEVTVTHANIESYNGEPINEPWLSSIDKYVSGATPTTGAQVVYPLTTPTTLTLTPAELELLKGNNTVSGNGVNINMDYIGR